MIPGAPPPYYSGGGDRTEHLLPRHRAIPLGSLVSIVVLLVLGAMFVHLLVTSPNLDWSVIWHYFVSGDVLKGLAMTIWLTVLAMFLAVVVGLLLASMRLSRSPILQTLSWTYLWVARSVPPLVQIVFWYNLSWLIPRMSFGIPFGPDFFSSPTNRVISAFGAALLGLTLNESAYMAEIFRGGIISVDPGQAEAAESLGMTGLQSFFRIILPQAMKAILPATGNEVINMLKTTSLVSVVALPDLLYSVELIYGRNYQTIPLLIVASLWYLIVSSLLSVGQHYLEQHFGRSTKKSIKKPRTIARFVGLTRKAA
ncbi:MAG: amino acid ABC transporter permease [Actinomycetia bacterium]|nr:amino acid ABC transporter permease [Actinomycetes bacterium]